MIQYTYRNSQFVKFIEFRVTVFRHKANLEERRLYGRRQLGQQRDFTATRILPSLPQSHSLYF
jgi:hypothetical protein